MIQLQARWNEFEHQMEIYDDASGTLMFTSTQEAGDLCDIKQLTSLLVEQGEYTVSDAGDIGQVWFPITHLSRADLVGEGAGLTEEQAMSISDERMERIADKMGDDYVEQLYWDSLRIISDYVLAGDIEEWNDQIIFAGYEVFKKTWNSQDQMPTIGEWISSLMPGEYAELFGGEEEGD